MTTSATISNINYSDYTEAQLCAVLDEIRTQKASLDSKEREIREVLHSLSAGSSDESLDFPTQETIDALNNSHTVLKTKDYAEFEKMIENKQ